MSFNSPAWAATLALFACAAARAATFDVDIEADSVDTNPGDA